ncbi:SsgA family sporulation/cell division regulator [Streptomyces sp. NPDC059861]|uniref:SsgA family sporulation/cell division regulator n=1 Tax=Streptomyces sp. NPDC059861 TaxID=3346974 RepID=UPI00364B5B36
MKLRYTARDPYALHATFPVEEFSGTVEWAFSRDLLAEGLTRRAGEGDVRVWPTAVGPGRDVLYIALGPLVDSALVEAFLPDLETFLRRTQSVVPPGAESQRFDMDAELAHLSAGS